MNGIREIIEAPTTTEQLRDAALPIWQTLREHEFPRGLAQATLPAERFRFYISQNILYLPEYARMIALGASHTHDLGALGESSRAMANILEVELPENVRMRDAIVQIAGPTSATDDIMAPATVAYTSWLISVAATGDAADVSAALLPCAWSYGEIARGLITDAVPHPVYTEWLRFFASDGYAAVVLELRTALDRDLRGMPATKRARLAEIFTTGCRMERLFWDQGLSGSHWPDLTR